MLRVLFEKGTYYFFIFTKHEAIGYRFREFLEYQKVSTMAAFSRKSCFATVVKFVSLIGVCS